VQTETLKPDVWICVPEYTYTVPSKMVYSELVTVVGIWTFWALQAMLADGRFKILTFRRDNDVSSLKFTYLIEGNDGFIDWKRILEN
jgi:hypothetical protein